MCEVTEKDLDMFDDCIREGNTILAQQDINRKLLDKVEKLQTKLDKAIKALEFYADENEWFYPYGSCWRLEFNSGTKDGDGFETAKQILKEIKDTP